MRVRIKRGDGRWFDKAQIIDGEAHTTKSGILKVTCPAVTPGPSEAQTITYRFRNGECLNKFGNPCYRVEVVS